MKTRIAFVAAISLWFAAVVVATAQYADDASLDSASQGAGLRKVLSDKPFFGTQSVLTLNGDYVNSPKEDYEQSGSWSLPLSLDRMNGVIGEVAFGQAEKQGEWQLSLRYKLIAMDSEWHAIADSSSRLTLSDRRSQVLKASYNVRDWWRLGVAAVVEDRSGSGGSSDPSTFGLTGREGLGFQIDTSLKF